jgi:uncharacterized protein (TIGR02246 family)
MFRSLMILSALTMGLAMPAAAQHISDQDAWKAGDSVVQAHNRASQAKDAAGLAALYAEDATLVGPDGPVFGRAALQKQFTDELKSFTAEPAKLERVTMIGDTVRLRTGSWSGMFQSPGGGPVHVKGYWATTDVRDGETWKIRMETWNVTMPPPTLEAAK